MRRVRVRCTYYICPDIIAFIQTLYYTSTRPVNKNTDSTNLRCVFDFAAVKNIAAS